jgi:Putative Flp pilus-assembly TadE/G-like
MAARLRELLGGEGGAVVVMAALWIGFGLVPMIGLVVETGNWYEHKRHLQAQVDAAALAGGDLFGDCFNGAGGSAGMLNEATKYGGVNQGFFNGTGYPSVAYPDSGIFNPQIGGDKKGTVTLLYQSKTYQGQPTDPAPDNTETQEPCSTPSLMFDVKGTESNLPVFASWLPLVGGGGGGGNCGLGLLVCNINAHARIQLRGLSSASPSLPLAVPDINPKQVGVTFIDEATGAELPAGSCAVTATKVSGTSCTYLLSKGVPVGGVNMWSGPATVTLPAAPAKVGVRVGMGGAVGSCAGTAGTAAYACFDAKATSGLGMIRDYTVAAPPPPVAPVNLSPPVLEGVWPSSCSSNGAFYYITTGTCAGGVVAEVNFGRGSATPPSSFHVRATVAGTTLDLAPVSYDSTRDAWFWSTPAGTSFNLPAGPTGGAAQGAQGITVSWEVNDTSVTMPSPYGVCKTGGGNKCSDTFPNAPQQRFYSGFDDPAVSGPIRSFRLTGGTDPNGPASLEPGTYTLTATVGVAGSYGLHVACAPPPSGGSYTCATDPATLLRFKSSSGSTTYAVDCGTVPGHTGGGLYQQILWGCNNSFSTNAADLCPDPASPTPPSCVPVGSIGSGVAGGQVRAAMNDRFAPGGICTTNNYPVVTPGDPRVLITMVTDFSAFTGSGASRDVPVVTFGAFYVTGWDRSDPSCASQEEPFSNTGLPGTSDTGDIWGHFIRYVAVGGGGGTAICDPSGILPCVPVLTQ